MTKTKSNGVRGEAIALFMSALKKSSTMSDALLYIEEDLVDDEAQSFIILIGYCAKNNVTIGRDNINSVMADAMEGLTLELENEYVAIHRKIIHDSNMETHRKADSFETEVLVKGNNVHVLDISYPMRGAVVESYDPATKTLVLKLK